MKKIISYNLNGIRAAVKKGFVEFLQTHDFDIIGIQETKAWENDIPTELFEAIGYKAYWHSAEKKGYSGVGILSKQTPDKVVIGCGIAEYDKEGRVIRADFGDVSVVSCYFPSGTSGEERQEVKMRFLKDMKVYFKALREERPNLIIMGDYNIAHDFIDVYNPDKAHAYSGFFPEERAWLSHWFEEDFVDAFRMMNPLLQEFSWWSFRRSNREFNRGWRIDYHSVSSNLKDKIVLCKQLLNAVHSDHCPVYLEIDI